MRHESAASGHAHEGSVTPPRMTAESHPTESAAKAAGRTSLGQRFQRALAGGPNRRFPGLHPSPGGAASLSPFLNRRLALPILALLALLSASLLFLLPGGLAHGQDGGSIEYAENGIDVVAAFTADDPEGRPVYWSLAPAEEDPDDGGDLTAADAADAGEFSISADGVLSFKFSPDYEMPRGDPRAGDNTNTYRVVVVAADEPLGVDDRVMGYEKVTVMVTDEDDPGMITLSAQQPQIGVELTAILTDDDAEDADEGIEAKWKWEHSESAGGPWTPILPATSATYTPRGVADKYLQVTATYTDEHGSDKHAQVVSPHMVRAVPANNATPVFPDEDTATPNTIEVGRKVDENSPPGTIVGDPVAADDAPGDVLTYALSGTDAGDYRIDQATGQITVGPRTMLDSETNEDDTVVVTATDPSDDAATQTVTITINDVNEAPTINKGVTKKSQDEYDTDDPSGEPVTAAKMVGEYAATDAEAEDTDAEAEGNCTACTWSVSGTDAGDFEISAAGALTFKEAPDYEMPVDSNRDNEYMVTVVATDAGVDSKNKMTAERDVVVTIMNVDEGGTVTLSTEQPKVGIALTATLDDPDGVVADSVKWTWHAVAADDVDADGDDANAIEMATSDTYTPEDEDIGPLSARASYTDDHGAGKEVVKATTNLVVANLANVAPKFPDTETGARKVEENTAAGANINIIATETTDSVDPVAATDDNDDTLTYMLGGTDMASFDIVRSNGQLQTKAKLDYETKNSYMVRVTATDPDGLRASIDVTIMVTDVDEAPEIAGEDISEEFRENGRNLEIERFRAKDPEGRPVYWSVLASTDDDLPIDVDGDGTNRIVEADAADAAEFSISADGVLSFNFPPDYENPRGDEIGDENTNTYKVVVVAADDPTRAESTEMPIMKGYKKVTVSVTNVDETETITLSAERAQVFVPLTATYNDLDEERPSGALFTWKWYLGGSLIEDSVMEDEAAGTNMYTPQNRGSLRVEASYTKTDGSIKEVSKTINVRTAPGNNAAPTFPMGSNARSVDENSPPGTKVGARVAANDDDRDTLTYALSGTDAGDYRIDQATGQITVGPRTMLDSETNEDDTVVVTATDPSGAPTDPPQTVTITINDVNEAPTINEGVTRKSQDEYDTDDPSGEPVTAAKMVGEYAATDAEAEDTDAEAEGNCTACTWSVSGTDAGDFEISAAGALTFKEAPDYEMPVDSNRDNEYMVTVVATDAGVDSKNKMTAERDVVVTIMNVDEDGTVTLSSEQPKVGIALTATLDDPDGVVADSVKWTWHRVADAKVDADDANAIEMATSDTYTPEDEDIDFLSARASYTDDHGAGKSVVKATANEVVENEANVAPKFPDTETGARKVEENTAAGANINISVTEDNTDSPDLDLVRATDDNVTDVLTYMLGGTDMASFDIDRLTGQLQTKAKLDYETKNSYMVTVTATDPDGLRASIDVTIMVTDEDEAPEITKRVALPNQAPTFPGAATTRTVDENTVAGEDIGAPVAATDADEDDALTYTLSRTDAASFDIISATGQLQTKAALDHETRDSYTVTVTATDEEGLSDAITVTINVADVEENPVFPGEATTRSVDENTVAGEDIGVPVAASEADEDDALTYTLSGTDAASFDIISASGQLQTKAALDYETRDSYTVIVTATDEAGLSDAITVTINVADVDENLPPVFPGAATTRSVDENTVAGEDIGAPVEATDADEDDALTYTLSGTDAASFDIISASGQLQTKAALDYETKDSYTVIVTATDEAGLSDAITVTINVADVDENLPPVFPGDGHH